MLSESRRGLLRKRPSEDIKCSETGTISVKGHNDITEDNTGSGGVPLQLLQG